MKKGDKIWRFTAIEFLIFTHFTIGDVTLYVSIVDFYAEGLFSSSCLHIRHF